MLAVWPSIIAMAGVAIDNVSVGTLKTGYPRIQALS
jgi:hypothetical protein